MNPYRALVRLAPRRLRDKHGAEMEALLRDRFSAAGEHGRAAIIVASARALLDIVSSHSDDIRYRWRRRGRVGLPRERKPLMLGSDLRYAWRSLSHQKLGTGLVIGMLALGIGATVAVFSLINGLFLRPFPFPEPERLVYIKIGRAHV